MKVGINLDPRGPASTDGAFKNLIYDTRPWVGTRSKWGDTELNLDNQGWVTNLPDGVVAAKLLATTSTADYPSGKYHVFYEGKGNLRYRYDASLVSSEPGHDIVEVKKPTPKGILLELTETNPNDYIKNIVFVHESNLDYKGNPFGEKFLETVSQFDTLRFMKWQAIDNKVIERNPTLNSASFFADGVPFDLLVDLCNRTNTSPWFCHHHAEILEIREKALYVRDNLNPDLLIRVEYTNEAWNPGLSQHGYCVEKAKELGLEMPDPHFGAAYYGQRASRIFSIWKEVFKGQEHRLLCCLGGHADDTRWIESVLEHASDYDAIAIAPYFGLPKPYLEQYKDWNLDQLFEQILVGGLLTNVKPHHENGCLKQSKRGMLEHKAIADKVNVRLVAYESGQHLTAFGNDNLKVIFEQAQTDPRMGDVYRQYYSDWQDIVGDLICHFSFVGAWGNHGYWGFERHIDYLEDSPKYQAIKEFLGNKPVVTPPVEPEPEPEIDIAEIKWLAAIVDNAVADLMEALK